ncbi:hypothetical protein LCGC14_2630030 [marine sediment metagenome]|uniref:Acb2/Tad1 hairpin domain-containing protein n=1 Tax=marine sediment metagenome TaxID=412755 RepID=A0A0F9CBI0_9ZZZZ
MPDPNDPNAQIPPEAEPATTAEAEPLTPEQEARVTDDAKSAIQGAMEDALDRSLAASGASGDGAIPLKTYPITDNMRARLTNEFTYHAPRQDQVPRYNALRSMALTFATMIVELTPPSREQSLALTKLSEASMHANAAIARDEEVPF